MTMRGPHRIAIDATRLDLGAPPPFEGIVEADDDGAGRNKGTHQQMEQAACRAVA